MNIDRIALVIVAVAAIGFIGGRDFVEHAQGAAAPVVRYQGFVPMQAPPMPGGSPISMIWLVGDDGKVRFCRGYAKLNLPPPSPDWDVQCSNPVTP